MSSGFRVSYDAGLVESAVLHAEPLLTPAERTAFRVERDRAYELPDPDEREARFEDLHARWFSALGLDRPLHQALAGEPGLLTRVAACRVAPVPSRRHEQADAFGVPGRGTAPTVVVRLCPESFLHANELGARLRHELLHVADMLDPAFGYERDPPRPGGGPAADALLRQRYHAVWDASIEGRLFRRGFLGEGARDEGARDFARRMPGLGDGAPEAYRRWFEEPRPTHAAILGFAASASRAARCRACGLPGFALSPSGVCPRCLEVLESARPGRRARPSRSAPGSAAPSRGTAPAR
jgi:hypothetical protein